MSSSFFCILQKCVSTGNEKCCFICDMPAVHMNTRHFGSVTGQHTGKVHPTTGHEGPQEEKMCICYSFFNHGATWDRWLTPRPGHLTPGKDSQYPLYRNRTTYTSYTHWPWQRKAACPSLKVGNTNYTCYQRSTTETIPTFISLSNPYQGLHIDPQVAFKFSGISSLRANQPLRCVPPSTTRATCATENILSRRQTDSTAHRNYLRYYTASHTGKPGLLIRRHESLKSHKINWMLTL